MHEEKLRRRRSSTPSKPKRGGDGGLSFHAPPGAEPSGETLTPGDATRPASPLARAASAQPTGRERYLPFVHAGVIATAAFVVYLTALRGPFLFDDFDHISERVRLGVFDRPVLPVVGGIRSTADFTFWANYRLGGANPTAFRLTNVLIHVVAAIVLYDLVRRTLLRPRFAGRYDPEAPWIAAAVAAIWAVHPLQTQAVSYIVQRMESLMGLFFLLTLYAMLRATDSSRATLWRIAAVGFLVLGLTTKEVMFVAPIVGLAFERIFLSDSWREVGRKWFWFLPPAGLAIGIGVWRAAQSVSVSAVVGSRSSVSTTEYFLNQSGVILHYLRLLFVPVGQNADYLWPVSHDPLYLASTTLVVTALFACGAWALYRYPPIGFLILSFFFLLGPTSSFLPIQDLAVEHRMYLASICVTTLVVVAVVELSRRWSSPEFSRSRRTTLAALAALAVVSFGAAASARNQVYASERAFWGDVVAKAPWNVRGWNAMTRLAIRDEDFAEAALDAERAVALKPNNVNANLLLALSLAKLDASDPRRRRAYGYAEKALKLDPTNDEALNAMGAVLLSEGKPAAALPYFEQAVAADGRQPEYLANVALAAIELGRFELAQSSLETALAVDPEFPDGAETLAVVRQSADALRRGELLPALRLPGESDREVGDRFARAGLFEQAAEHLRRAVADAPDDDAALSSLAVAESRLGNADEAVRLATESARLAPKKYDPAYAQGVAFAAAGDHASAIAAYERASRMDAIQANAHAGRALSLAALGRTADAANAYLRAIELDPRNPSPCNNLGNLLASENPPLAERYFREALAIEPGHVNARLNLGNLLARTGRLTQALTEYDVILAARPGYLPAERSRAAVLAMMKPSP